MVELSKKKCVPCTIGTPTIKGDQLKSYLEELKSNWQAVDEHHIEKTFNFKNFCEALSFTNKVGEIAETEGHHPDIYLSWGKVKITLWTHKAGGLTENDFILAAKIDKITG